MCHTYVIYSQKIDKYYVGACKDDLSKRIENHQTGRYGGKSFTSNAADWILKLQFKCETFSHAVRLERKIKSMKSKVYIENLLKYKELRTKIFEQTKST